MTDIDDDPILDALLDEALGGIAPPDVSQAILARSAAERFAAGAEPDHVVAISLRSPRKRERRLAYLAASAAAVIAVAFGIWRLSGKVDDTAASGTPKAQEKNFAVGNRPNANGQSPSPQHPVPAIGADTTPTDLANNEPSDKRLSTPDAPPSAQQGDHPESADAPRHAPSFSDAEMIARIDKAIAERWQAESVAPSEKADDAKWCRRLFLAVVGRIPTVDELERFLGDRSSDKRERLVDALLGSDQYAAEYAENAAVIWTSLLVGRATASDAQPLVDREGIQQYLRQAFRENMPYDRMAIELITARGVNKPGEDDFNGAVNFLAAKLDDRARLATTRTAQTFLGMQLQCVECHNHPFNEWKQETYWQLNAFFRQARPLRRFAASGRSVEKVRLADEDFAGEGNQPDPSEAEIYFEQRNGLTKAVYPTFLDGQKINPSGYVDDVVRRRELARMIVESDAFAQSQVNRVWERFFGYGFTRPVDDMGPHNPPSHPELLAELGRQFAASGFDQKSLVRWIALSQPYALSSRANDSNRQDDPLAGAAPLFSHYYARQMRPEQLYDSLSTVAFESTEPDTSMDSDSSDRDAWLAEFTIAYDTDEQGETLLLDGGAVQTLEMMNGSLIRRATDSDQSGFLRTVATSKLSNQKKLDKLYLASIARRPTRAEAQRVNNLLVARRGSAPEALEDVWWALLNSNEFILDH